MFYEQWNLSQHDRRFHTSLKTLYSRYRKEVAEAISESFGGFGRQANKAQELSSFLVNAAEGAAIQWFLDPKSIDPRRLARLADQFLDSVFESQP